MMKLFTKFDLDMLPPDPDNPPMLKDRYYTLLAAVAELLAADEARARDISRLTEERDAALAKVERFRSLDIVWNPSRWWRVLDASGDLQAETSDSTEARSIARELGGRLQRQWFSSMSEWRDEK